MISVLKVRSERATGPSAAPNDHGLGERIVVAVANAPDRGLDAGFRQPFGVTNGEVLRSAVAVVDEPRFRAGATGVEGLLERIEDQPCLHAPRDAPAHDPSGIGVDE
jgi:hypothetical protein